MSGKEDRRLVFAHAAIGLAVCIGSYMVLVDGPRKKLLDSRSEAQVLASRAQAAEGLRDRVPAMTTALDSAQREAARLRDLGQAARDERGLFAAMMALAAKHGVRLDELNPARSSGSSARETPKPGAPADIAVGYSMLAVGGYAEVSAFLGAINAELGHALIRSARLTPVQNDRVRQVQASIETEHYSFDTTARQPVADARGK